MGSAPVPGPAARKLLIGQSALQGQSQGSFDRAEWYIVPPCNALRSSHSWPQHCGYRAGASRTSLLLRNTEAADFVGYSGPLPGLGRRSCPGPSGCYFDGPDGHLVQSSRSQPLAAYQAAAKLSFRGRTLLGGRRLAGAAPAPAHAIPMVCGGARRRTLPGAAMEASANR
jgi:hypothetical protein